MQDHEDQDSKTESPTPGQIEKFRKRGEVVFSREVTAACALAAALLTLVPLGGWAVDQFAILWGMVGDRIAAGPHGPSMLDRDLYVNVMTLFAKMLAPPALTSAIVILLAGLSQTRLNFTLKALEPKLNKFNPLPQLKKMFFSARTVVDLTRSVVKIAILGTVAVYALVGQSVWLLRMPHLTLEQDLALSGQILTRLLAALGVALLVMAALDYAWQWYQLNKRMRMSKQEIKDEYKEKEGDPLIKAARRQKMRQMAQERSQVQRAAEATVVIVNPTHIAIALRYIPGQDDAPMVLCKGKDQIAAEIRTIARRAGVPIIQRKPLARLMIKTCKVGQVIPMEVYEAVAEVLAMVMRARRR